MWGEGGDEDGGKGVMRMGERRGDEAGIGWGELGKGETSKIDGSGLKEGGDEE